MSETNEQKARKWLDERHIPGRSIDGTFFRTSIDELAKVIAPLFEAAESEASPGGEATPTLADGLRDKSDNAYCSYIQQLKQTPCLGWEQKVKEGRFGKTELDAHCAAHEQLGRHRGLAEAARLIRESGERED